MSFLSRIVVALIPGALGFGCFSDYSFSWCLNHTEASCIHDYTFSVSHFQRKLDSYYRDNKRPPLLEAYFLIKLPKTFQEQFLDSDCAPPLVMAYVMVAEARLQFDPQALMIFELGMSYLERISADQAYLLNTTNSWPLNIAVERIQQKAQYYQQLQGVYTQWLRQDLSDVYVENYVQNAVPGQVSVNGQMQPGKIEFGVTKGVVVFKDEQAKKLAHETIIPTPEVVVDFVMSHCKETDLGWMRDMLRPAVDGLLVRFFTYEKCHQSIDVEKIAGGTPEKPIFYSTYSVQVPDPSFVARGDECSAYLSHIVHRYDKLGDFTFFIHSDPGDHMHLSMLNVMLKSILHRTFEQDFMHLNGPRHVRTITPCIQAIANAMFGHNISGMVGPYCCAQFMVGRGQIYSRPRAFYERMLMLVNGTLPYDLCTTSRVARSSHCYAMEFLWHVVWGEPGDPPLRADDERLPITFRLKYGVEHDKKDWNDVTLSPNVPKKIVSQQDWNGQEFVWTRGGPGSEKRGDDAPRPEWTDPALNPTCAR